MSPSSASRPFEAKQPPPQRTHHRQPGSAWKRCTCTSGRRTCAICLSSMPPCRWKRSAFAAGNLPHHWSGVGHLSPDRRRRGHAAHASESGDWVGAVITPWFINLFVLPGGGNLWSDRRPGQRCHILFPIGPLEFIADHDPTASDPLVPVLPAVRSSQPVRLASSRARGSKCRAGGHAHGTHGRGPEVQFRRNFSRQSRIRPGVPSFAASPDPEQDGRCDRPPAIASFFPSVVDSAKEKTIGTTQAS
jgi:hypothetical protein